MDVKTPKEVLIAMHGLLDSMWLSNVRSELLLILVSDRYASHAS